MTALNRDQIEQRLIKRVEDFERGYRQNVAVLGSVGLGKSYLLSKIADSLRARTQLLPVLISPEEVAAPHLISYWIRRLLSAALRVPESEVEGLLESSESTIPKTSKAARHILKLQKQGNSNLAVSELFALGGQLAEETGCKIVFLLDELLGLKKFSVHDPYSLFGNQLMMEKEALFIVASSHPKQAREIFSEKLELLFSNFEVLEMQPLGFYEMNAWIDSRVSGSFLSLPIRRFLFRLTDGHTRYLDRILRVLDESVCSDPRRQLGPVSVFEAVIREVLEVDGRISLEFQKRVASLRRSVRERASLVQEAVAVFGSGRVKPSALATSLNLSLVESKKLIMRFEEEGWLTSCGPAYTLKDPLFRFWARECLAGICTGQLDDARLRRSRWTRQLGQIFEMGLESDSHRIAARLESLLKLFKSDAIVLEGRKIPGAHFHEITCSLIQEGQWVVRAHAAKEVRFFLVSTRELRESDMESFWALSGGRKKPVRRVVVAAGGIEQNAKLLTQQNRMEIWDLRFFNRLLDFFGIAKVIIEKKDLVWQMDSAWMRAPGLFSAEIAN